MQDSTVYRATGASASHSTSSVNMIKLVLLSALVAVASAGFIPLDYHHYPVVVHKPLATSYSYFHKVDHSVPVVKTIFPAPLVYKPLPFYHGLHFGYPHHF